MKVDFTILILLICYSLMLGTVVVAKKINAAIFARDELRSGDLDALNYLHLIFIALMLLAGCTIKSLPYFIMQFPDRISVGQLVAFLMTFGGLSFFPWKRLNHDGGVTQHSSQGSTFRVT